MPPVHTFFPGIEGLNFPAERLGFPPCFCLNQAVVLSTSRRCSSEASTAVTDETV